MFKIQKIHQRSPRTAKRGERDRTAILFHCGASQQHPALFFRFWSDPRRIQICASSFLCVLCVFFSLVILLDFIKVSYGLIFLCVFWYWIPIVAYPLQRAVLPIQNSIHFKNTTVTYDAVDSAQHLYRHQITLYPTNNIVARSIFNVLLNDMSCDFLNVLVQRFPHRDRMVCYKYKLY